MKNRFFEKFDYLLLICILVLISLGIAFIYSSGVNSEGILVTNEYIKQIIWASIGLVILLFFALFDYKKTERYATWIYLGLIVILIYTRIFGRYVNGARSWIGIGDFGVQPSEFGKIAFILLLAKYLSQTNNEVPLKRFFISVLIFIVPFGLILIQPDLGTATVYIPIFFIMCFMAGVKIKYLLFLLGCGISMVIFTILPVYNTFIAKGSVEIITLLTNQTAKMILILSTMSIGFICLVIRRYFHGNKYFLWISFVFISISIGLLLSTFASKILKEYQIKRLIVFMNPEVDPLGAGWNIIQSKVAIGSGGLWGTSFLQGTQSHYRFLPQQSTDFIFSIISEEFGFVGGIVVYIAYLIIMIRNIYIIKNSSNQYGSLIASGILGMLIIHFFINVGMVMGMMPITGIPLLFLSYGGSSLLTAMSCMGLLMSINYRRYDFS